jgi:hypothetical protein
LYVAYGLLGGLAVAAALALLIGLPAANKPLVLLLLILMLLAWVLALALTATLR